MPTSVKIERVGDTPINWNTVAEGDDRITLHSLLTTSEVAYIGRFNSEVACVWGLIPPTLLSDTAHLWLFTTDVVKENQFLFVRHSQLVMDRLLNRYPNIIGTTDSENKSAIRWIRWLGGEYIDQYTSPQDRKFLTFVIRKKT
jgi:hypothetical protein